MKIKKPIALSFICLASLLTATLTCAQAIAQEKAGQKSAPQRIVKEGVAVELSVAPLPGGGGKTDGLLEGESALVRIKITDTATNNPVTNLHPVAWMAHRLKSEPTNVDECKDRIRSFLQGTLKVRPDIDLNAYYIVVMNRDASISVIDPLLGYGGTKLLAMAILKSPGEDWALTSDKKRLFVTMPLVNQVAVIDTMTWKVTANINVGIRPMRLALQPDEKYLWVGNDGLPGSRDATGVSVIDTADLKVRASINTGAGHHEMDFTPDDRFAFVTNREDGTLSVVDVQKLQKTVDIKTGSLPASVAFSPLSKAVYVASEGDGAVTAVDARSHKVLARVSAQPGIRVIRFAEGGRWGFLVNSKENAVHVLDSSDNSIQQTIPVGKEPDQIAFTQKSAFVRSIGTEMVTLINLSSVAKGEKAAVTQFPGGQIPAGSTANAVTANAIVPSPEGNTILIANTQDRQVYYYMEGMNAPMGNFQTYKREPKAVAVVDKSLREISPGVYSTNIKLGSEGNYDVAFLLNTPKITHCFNIAVEPDPSAKKYKGGVALRVEPMFKTRQVTVGEEVRLKFKVTDAQDRRPKDGLKDFSVMAMLAPGINHSRQWARPLGEGVYEATFAAKQTGVYYIFLGCPSLKVGYNHLPYVILEAVEQNKPIAEK